MGNIISYLKWRGDLTFTERPFCEVDNLVLSELSYLDFSGIVPTVEQGGSISIADAAKMCEGTLCKVQSVSGSRDDFLSVMAESKRYRDVKLSNYADILDKESGVQFAALHITLGDGTVYVAFRGTSDSLVGWREDFSMSFQLMPAQKLAATYLAKTINDSGMKYRIGGHSKGGSMAVYAAMMCSEEQKERIMEVYSNDGPGICKELLDMEQYRKLQPKLIRIVPEFSIIGSLFEQEPPTKIVASSASGFAQHEGMSWEIEGDHFCEREELTKECRFFNQIFDQWIESADMEQRKSFTKDFFDALEAGGAHRVSDLTRSGVDEVEIILLSIIQSESKTKLVIGKLLKSFFSAFGSIQFSELIREKGMIQGTVLFLIGLFFVGSPEVAAQGVGMGMAVMILFWLGKKQLDCACSENDSVYKKKGKMILEMVLMCAVMFLIAQRSLMLRFSNLLLGGFFLFRAYRWIQKAFQPGITAGSRISNTVLAAFSFLIGIVPIITAGFVLKEYVFSAGSCILLYSVGKIVHTVYQNGKTNLKKKQNE